MDLLSSNSSIDIIFGPMFSGKTTEMVRRMTILSEAGLKVLYINSILDTRDDVCSSHNKSLKLQFDAVKTKKLFDQSERVKNYNVIGIDESQFFSDLKEFCLYVSETLKAKVIVAGLNGDFKRENFGQINDLIPVCDTVTKLYPFCMSCSQNKILRAAMFSKRRSASPEQIQIGAGESYIPVCRDCYITP